MSKETYIFEKEMIIKVEAEVVRECVTRDVTSRMVWEVQHLDTVYVFIYIKETYIFEKEDICKRDIHVQKERCKHG